MFLRQFWSFHQYSLDKSCCFFAMLGPWLEGKQYQKDGRPNFWMIVIECDTNIHVALSINLNYQVILRPFLQHHHQVIAALQRYILLIDTYRRVTNKRESVISKVLLPEHLQCTFALILQDSTAGITLFSKKVSLLLVF